MIMMIQNFSQVILLLNRNKILKLSSSSSNHFNNNKSKKICLRTTALTLSLQWCNRVYSQNRAKFF